MNAVEIEEAISELAAAPYDAPSFPFAFLEAFGNKPAVIAKLKKGTSNSSDVESGVLQRSNIHIATCDTGKVTETLGLLKQSAATQKAKAKFALATDGETIEAEDLNSGETIACEYADLPNHFGFFLALAGITTVKQIRESSFDIRATGRLNKLYVQLLNDNEDWRSEQRRPDMNHFMARLIFCFFAEDTDIFHSSFGFTDTIEKMSERSSSNTHEVIGELFRAMNTKITDRKSAGIKSWADPFPYVNGGLFSGSLEVPKFSKIARSYLIHIGNLDWKRINPDIFGSMIQAVADDEERGALGMHYTSVPNILKVLNPLFLDDLRGKLEEAGDSSRKLLNLRNRMAKIRVFDPACGSGNFLVIAYKEMREIEAEINKRRGEEDRKTSIPLTNFRGIELRDFPAEIARLALIIAEYQCDVTYRGQKEALDEFLPLDAKNWITCGNALRLDWLSICPPTGTGVKHHAEDLLHTPKEQAEIDFENEGGETYICGNPPYAGATVKPPKNASQAEKARLKKEAASRKADMKFLFENRVNGWKSLDYVAAWFLKAADFGTSTKSKAALVSTNSICQGQQVAAIWPEILSTGNEILFAYTSFSWANLAKRNAAVTVVIVCISTLLQKRRQIYSVGNFDETQIISAPNINAYLIPFKDIYIKKSSRPLQGLSSVFNGSKPADGGGLIFNLAVAKELEDAHQLGTIAVRPFFGAHDATHGIGRYCIWIDSSQYSTLKNVRAFQKRFEIVQNMRNDSDKETTKLGANTPYLFQEIRQTGEERVFQIPRHSSENRKYFPVAVLPKGSIVGDGGFAFFDPPRWNIAIFASRLCLLWIATVCGKIKEDYRFSNTLGWNTFPVPPLTEKNKVDLTRCAEDILLAREVHFPATIADLYDPEKMPQNLRDAHNRNDEVLERIYIGRRFKNDTERLEKLFELYTKMTTKVEKSVQ